MQESWWKDEKDLRDEQKAIINLPPEGNYLVLGPPGSGKTNLLLLRVKWLSVSGKKNILFLTLGRSLAEFIKTGIGPKKIIDPDQVKTYMRWAYDLAVENRPSLLTSVPDGFEESRAYWAMHLKSLTAGLPNGYYDAIVIDEIQDLSGPELAILQRLTPRLMAAGDSRQSIYAGSGVEVATEAGFIVKSLQFHYRIGKAICSVADIVYPPELGEPTLLQRSQYDEKLVSSAEPVHCSSLEEQAVRLVDNVRLQLKSYPGESVGVLAPTFKKGVLDAIRDAFDAADFSDLVEYHGGKERDFPEGKRVFVLTCHSAKGMEFRAVNIVAAENMVHGSLGRRALIFTSVTRAKTSLRVYYAGKLPATLDTAFSKPAVPEISSIF
ncbi:MAG: ATP-binding domain-containing protein [Pseudomonadota bacterium]